MKRSSSRAVRFLGDVGYCVVALLAAAISTLDSHAQLPVADNPRVDVSGGTLEGRRFGPAPAAVFLGIPFASPPTGELRWKPPQPVAAWKGVRQAGHFSKACLQPPEIVPVSSASEDCLYLNVWTPELSSRPRLPVLVYFHYGSNKIGTGALPRELGPALAREGLVVVSINYRLGALGFMAHPELTGESLQRSSGNYGLLDQLAALRWVHDNIAQFGGDPARVTAYGMSAGAGDICLLMTSPLANGLIHRAILESGSCSDSLLRKLDLPVHETSTRPSAHDQGSRLAAALGVSSERPQLGQLRAIPAEQIVNVAEKSNIGFGANVDGWVLPRQPAVVYAEGAQARIPVIVGANSDEATVMFNSTPTTLAHLKQVLVQELGEYAERVWNLYPIASDADVSRVFLELESDFMGSGARNLARSTPATGQSAYLYCLDHVGPGKYQKLGAFHGELLMLLSESWWDGWSPRAEDLKLAKQLRRYWVQFAKSGNPNEKGSPAWPPYDAEQDTCLRLGSELRTIQVPHAKRFDAFDKILREILAAQ